MSYVCDTLPPAGTVANRASVTAPGAASTATFRVPACQATSRSWTP
jgi:hypothetical protein